MWYLADTINGACFDTRFYSAESLTNYFHGYMADNLIKWYDDVPPEERPSPECFLDEKVSFHYFEHIPQDGSESRVYPATLLDRQVVLNALINHAFTDEEIKLFDVDEYRKLPLYEVNEATGEITEHPLEHYRHTGICAAPWPDGVHPRYRLFSRLKDEDGCFEVSYMVKAYTGSGSGRWCEHLNYEYSAKGKTHALRELLDIYLVDVTAGDNVFSRRVAAEWYAQSIQE